MVRGRDGGNGSPARGLPARGRAAAALRTWAAVAVLFAISGECAFGATVVGGITATALPLCMARRGSGRQPFKLSRCGESSVLDVCETYLLRGSIAASASMPGGAAPSLRNDEATESGSPSARDPTDVPRARSALQRTTDASLCAPCEHCTGRLRLC
uniref:Uncharacterized protein n=1 Tax=Hemiselmis tepida TaxID=464990 RepID=A0A7S0W0C7_9CRYP|mmetsp:Transcript_23576/g.59682  ORF Transcript_23576/g.59682 Transcript_23576/m.59682 type:complete len:157 (+) Transcript_23576:128-598(+)